MVRLSAAAADNRTSARALWAGVACYTLAWLYFTLVDMHSQTLALHPDALVWRLGASPVALLAYLSLYWFASDFGSVDQASARPQATQSVISAPPASAELTRTARTAV
jgi:hypothetical protein